MSRPKAFAAAAVTLSVIVTVLGLEAALRAHHWLKNRRELAALPPVQERLVIPSEDPELIYELNPGVVRGNVSINDWGMRDDPVTQEKPPGTFRIAFVGDSISCGLGLCEKSTLYHDVLERELNADAPPGRRFECLNFSANGYSIGQELRLFQLRVRKFDPDVVVVQSCLNDPYPTDGAYVHQQPTGPSRLVSFVWARVAPDSFYAHWAVTMTYDTRGLALLSRGLRGFASEARKGPPILVVLFPYLDPQGYGTWDMDRLHRTWRDEAARADIPFVDLKSAFSAGGEINGHWPTDPLHPTVGGHRLAARAIRKELETRGLLSTTEPRVER